MARPAFTRGHYIRLAGAIRKNGMDLDSLCAMFAEDNPRFSPEAFRKACGGAE